ncbi:transcription intermediary factor 1-alpha-like isoform X1 [Argopecten irradians]|uniref:transcription intermediary factor 1-alpha-like isoform X1 n=1 Tax=Argopecten irradians TaxID=31199 RepID=UPI0037135640
METRYVFKVAIIQMELHKSSISTCDLCRKTCNRPKYLSCLHTFCEICLHNWIVSEVKEPASKLPFKCPSCDIDTDPPVGWTINNVSQWASLYPDDHLMQSCIDREEIRNGTKSCNICKVSSVISKANYWCRHCSEGYCDSCEAVHTAMKISKNHEIVPVNQALYDHSRNTPNEPCSKHPEEDIRLFCADHDKPCCALCSMVDHRRCKNVINLQEAATNSKSKQELTKETNRLKRYFNETHDVEFKVSQITKELTQERLHLKDTAEGFVDRICHRMRDLLRDYNTKLDKTHANAVAELALAREDAMKEQRFLRNALNRFECTSISEEQGFLCLKRTIAKHKNVTKIMNISEQMCDKTLKHSEPPDVQELLCKCLSVVSLGDVTIEDREVPHSTSRTLHDVNKWFIDSQTTKPVQNIACFYSENCIIIAGFEDKKIYSYDSKGLQTSAIDVPHRPFAVAVIGSSIIATFPEVNTVSVFNLKPRDQIGRCKLSYNLQNTCYGISAVPDHIDSTAVVVCDNMLVIVDAELGTETDKILLHDNGYRQVIVDKSFRAFVTNSNNHRVVCVNLATGLRLFTFTDYSTLKYPCGISLDPLGNVYVVGTLSKNIVKLTTDGKYEDIVLSLSNGLYHPHDVAFKRDSFDFIVTNDVDVRLFTFK